MPEPLRDFRGVLEGALAALGEESNGGLSVEWIDPTAGDGAVAVEIAEQYGFRPMATSLFDSNTFYFHLTLTDGETLVQIPVPEALSAEAAKKGLEEGLKRFATGLLRTVALSTPSAPPPMMGMGQPPAGNQYTQLRSFLESDFAVEAADLAEVGFRKPPSCS